MSAHLIAFSVLAVFAGLLGRDALWSDVFTGTWIRSGVFWLGCSRSRPQDIGTGKSAFLSCTLRPALFKLQWGCLSKLWLSSERLGLSFDTCGTGYGWVTALWRTTFKMTLRHTHPVGGTYEKYTVCIPSRGVKPLSPPKLSMTLNCIWWWG